MLITVETTQTLCNNLGVCELKCSELLKQSAEERKVFWCACERPTILTAHRGWAMTEGGGQAASMAALSGGSSLSLT